MKSITPVISVILLILLTIIASVSSYFFINSNVIELQNQGSVDTYPGSDNSRLNLVSITGSKAIVRNDGISPITEVIVFINDELFNYTLDEPIMPGELKQINYIPQLMARDLEIKVIYNAGKASQSVSPARVNTELSGFVESNCPDTICDVAGGENMINCFSDCGIQVFLHQHEDYNGVDDAIVMLQTITDEEGNIHSGNRSVIYAPGGGLSNEKIAFLDNDYYVSIFDYNENPQYIYYDGFSFSNAFNITDYGNINEIRNVGAKNNAHIMYINCTYGSSNECDLVYLNWSFSDSFSSIEKITNLSLIYYNYSYTPKSPHFSVSNNENYKLAAWSCQGTNNYTFYSNGWSETETLFYDADVSMIDSAKINNQGEILIIYTNSSKNEAIIYNGSQWEKIDNSLFESSGIIESEPLNDSFLIIYSLESSPPYFLNSTILKNNEFSNIQTFPFSSIAGFYFFKLKYDQYLGFAVNISGYATSFMYDESDNSWKNEIKVAISGVENLPTYCQEYERFSGECPTETWCSDGVDNDEDGLYDMNDPDCQ